MIIVKIKGGLGNQLFCYAYAKSLSLNGEHVKIDNYTFFNKTKLHGGYHLNKFKITLESATLKEIKLIRGSNRFSKAIKVLNKPYIRENDLKFDQKFLELRGNLYVEGYFQSEKYFNNYRDIIINEFKFPNSDSIKKQRDFIKDKFCSIHVRRGDFTSKTNSEIHGILDLSYYYKAIKLIKEKGIKNFIIFSDDIDWCKNNFYDFGSKIQYSDFGLNEIDDLNLMSKCSSNIIANSTYSWWGAWLNKNKEKIVIAPKMWLKSKPYINIAAQNWILL